MLKRLLRWGDVAFFVGVFVIAAGWRPRTLAWGAGLMVAALSFPCWIAARLELGSAFTARAEARHLVTTGFYRRLRHPIYLFGCLAYAGALLAIQDWTILAAWTALTPIELVRMRREERALEAAFGDAYRRYRSTTWF